MISINGKTYKGNSIQIINNQVVIDGKKIDDSNNEKVINITVEGSINNLDVDYCNNLNITGDCESVTSKNGNIQVKGNVNGDATNKNGNIVCRNVGGNATTKNGDVIHS